MISTRSLYLRVITPTSGHNDLDPATVRTFGLSGTGDAERVSSRTRDEPEDGRQNLIGIPRPFLSTNPSRRQTLRGQLSAVARPAGNCRPHRTYPSLLTSVSRQRIMTAPPPVSFLPPELLARIFECFVTHSNPTILLQVCHRWADLASSISSLWSRIDFSTPPGPFLRHSINQPIEVILSNRPAVPTSTLLAIQEILRHHGDRIRKLSLYIPPDQLQEIGPDLSRPFPILMDVSISVNHIDYAPPLYPDNLPEWRPVTIHNSPIRYLKLLLVKTPWIPGCFRDLVEFYLHDQWNFDFNPSMGIFLEILESSPRLTVLSVANAGPQLLIPATTLPSATRVVHLPNLQRLYLEQGDPCDIGWMLIHLIIPTSTNVKIFTDLDYDAQPIPFLELTIDLLLPNHPGFPHFTNLRRCTYAIDVGPKCIITATNLTLVIAWNGLESHFDNFMMPFLRRATVIEDLAVILKQSMLSAPSAKNWDQIFGTLPALQKLELQQLSRLVKLPVGALFESSPGSTPRDLWLAFLVFPIEPPGERGEGGLAEKLVKYCAERDQRGYRLEHLVIGAPINPPPDLASSLAPYVDHLEIREEALNFKDIGEVEFGSIRAFDF